MSLYTHLSYPYLPPLSIWLDFLNNLSLALNLTVFGEGGLIMDGETLSSEECYSRERE